MMNPAGYSFDPIQRASMSSVLATRDAYDTDRHFTTKPIVPLLLQDCLRTPCFTPRPTWFTDNLTNLTFEQDFFKHGDSDIVLYVKCRKWNDNTDNLLHLLLTSRIRKATAIWFLFDTQHRILPSPKIGNGYFRWPSGYCLHRCVRADFTNNSHRPILFNRRCQLSRRGLTACFENIYRFFGLL
jgi:hypothetical protein